jgi:demethylmenaquinone methyltransferase / 2-methoxy-6-polyprenyl-1,4-benzoquinol methylase
LSGLGHLYWLEVIEVLRSVIPIYDKVNRTISFGKDSEFRLDGIHGRIFPGNIILDAGSGYGNMSFIALNELDGHAKIILYDPIHEMLTNSKGFFRSRFVVSLSSGIFEYMPFQNNTFDVVMCGYSLRDAIQLKKAIFEIHRVLKKGGRVIIIDLGKPDNPIVRACVSFYLKYILGILAFGVAGKAGLHFKTLYGTYKRWPTNSELYRVLNDKFSKVCFDKAMMGAAIIVVAYK